MARTIHVDDFGCVPDGRLLRRASMRAGDVELRDDDGPFRATDVGKFVAVPGAADLETTVSALVGRVDVSPVSITANGLHLVAGPSEEEDRPERRSHFVAGDRDLRITVEGAGPSGGALVADVDQVVNSTTLKLTLPATTTVSSANAVLYAPDRVTLGTHARAVVGPFSMTVGARTIDDAAMSFGSAALHSATADFTDDDLGKEVTVPGVGVLVATIVAVLDRFRVQLSDPATHDVHDAQADVWRTDSRPGLELILAGRETRDVQPLEIRFGAGVYDFSRRPVGNVMKAAIALGGCRNITLRGAGAGLTTLRLMPDQDLDTPDSHVVHLRNCSGVAIRDLSVHGSFLTLATVNEQMHGILVDEGCEDITAADLHVVQTSGDGIRLVGAPDHEVRRVLIDTCSLVENKRSGIGFQRSVRQVRVQGCHIVAKAPSTDACLDFEPSGQGQEDGGAEVVKRAPSEIVIDSNVMVHETDAAAVTLSGLSGADPLLDVQFTRNRVIGGAVFCTDVARMAFSGNLVSVPSDRSPRIAVNVQRGGHDLLISDNTFIGDNPAAEAVLRLSEVNGRPTARATVHGNICRTRARNGIAVLSSHDMAVEANLVIAAGECGQGILLRAETSDVRSVSIRDNDITVDSGAWKTGIHLTSGEDFSLSEVSVTANSVRGAQNGIHINRDSFTQPPLIALNRMADDVIQWLHGLAQAPHRSIVVGGAIDGGSSGLGGGRVLAGLADPTQTDTPVPGFPGDVYQRLGGAPGPRLFVKESGDGTVDGWVAT